MLVWRLAGYGTPANKSTPLLGGAQNFALIIIQHFSDLIRQLLLRGLRSLLSKRCIRSDRVLFRIVDIHIDQFGDLRPLLTGEP